MVCDLHFPNKSCRLHFYILCLFWTEYVVSSDLGGGGQCISCYSKTCWIKPEAIPLRGSSEGLGITVHSLGILVNNDMGGVMGNKA